MTCQMRWHTLFAFCVSQVPFARVVDDGGVSHASLDGLYQGYGELQVM